MQRVPSKNIRMSGTLGSNMQEERTRNAETPERRIEDRTASGQSPLVLMARRIREEQGAEQVAAFLHAMRPFAAPNELKKVGSSFGVDAEGFADSRSEENRQAVQKQQQNTPPQSRQMPQLQMLQTIMALQNLMGNGSQDTSALLRALAGMPGR